MKKTVSVRVENERYITSLMADIGFMEVNRVVTGGMMSEVQVLITYEGDEQDYHENGYICVKDAATIFLDNEPVHRWFSLRLVDGHSAPTLESFKKTHDQWSIPEIIVNHF